MFDEDDLIPVPLNICYLFFLPYRRPVFPLPVEKPSEPFIQGHRRFAEVAGYEAVVKVVEVGPGYKLSVEKGAFEPVVARGRGQGGQLDIEKEMQGMGGKDKMDCGHAEVEEVLDGVHGEAGPGSRVGVHMMDGVDGPEKGAPVDQPVNQIEVQLSPEGDQ